MRYLNAINCYACWTWRNDIKFGLVLRYGELIDSDAKAGIRVGFCQMSWELRRRSMRYSSKDMYELLETMPDSEAMIREIRDQLYYDHQIMDMRITEWMIDAVYEHDMVTGYLSAGPQEKQIVWCMIMGNKFRPQILQKAFNVLEDYGVDWKKDKEMYLNGGR